MASIKLHVYRIEMGDSGQESCDFRGKGEHGAGEDDQHRTVLELDPAGDDHIAEVVEIGPSLNKVMSMFEGPNDAGHIASVLGLEGHGPIGLRLGVWDQ